jgi:transcriptional regulator NrdR family protein
LVGKLVIPANEKKYVDSIYQVILKLDLNGIIYVKIKDLSDKEYYYDKVLKFEKSENVEDLRELDSEDINKRDFRKNKYEMKKIIENIKLALLESKLEKEDMESIIEEIELLDKNSVDYVTSVKYVEELKEKYGHLQYDVEKDVEIDVKKDVINDNYSDNLYNKYLKDKLKAFLDLEKVDKSDSLKEIINNTLEEFDNFEQMEIKIKISEIESILENSDDLDDYNEFKELIYFIEFQMESDNLDINEKQKISLEKRLLLEKSYLENTKLDFKEKINSFNLFCEKLLE